MKTKFPIEGSQQTTSKDEIYKLDLSDRDNLLVSSSFSKKKDFISALLLQVSSSYSTTDASKLSTNIAKEETSYRFGSDEVTFYVGWKNTQNISARLIEKYGDSVILECLVDRENKVYEEREFRASLFSNYDLEIGSLFYLRIFDRPNETRLEIHDDPNLNFIDDFPKLDFKGLIENSKLFK